MPTYAELLAKKRAATSGGVKGTPQPAQKTGAKTYAQMLDERRGIKPVVAKKTAAPAVKEPIMSVAPKKTQPAAPIMSVAPKKEATTFSSVPKEQKELIAEPAKKTITQRIGDTVKKGLGMLGSVNLPSAIAGQASKMAATAAVKDPKVTAEKAGNAALRTGTALLGSTTSALRFAQEKIQSNPTVLRDPVTNFILKKAGGEAIDKKLTQLSQWAAQYDPTGPMLKKADESLQAYSKRISPVTESYERAPLKEKLTTRLGETFYNYLPETAGAMVPYLLQPEVGALMMFGDTANRIKQDALVNGVDPKTAEQTAVRAAAGIAVLDRLGVGKIAPGVKSKITQALVKNTGKLWSVIKEPFTEAAQEWIQIMAERTFKNVGLSEEQERLAMSAFLGIFFDQGMRGAGLAKSALETRQMPENFDKVDSNTQAEFMSAVSAVQKEQALGEVSPQTMARFVAVANQVDETIVAAKTNEVRAEVINEAINSPINEETTALIEEIEQDPDMLLGFEQTLVDLKDANDPLLEETSQKQGLVFKRIYDPNDPALGQKKDLPASYNIVTGEIIFNEPVKAKTLKHLADGKVIVIGEGKLMTSFSMKEGESLAELNKRFETELIKHEIAHAKTITQEDINLFEKLQAEGKTAEANRLRINLEERANKYTVLNAKKELDSDTADLISKVVSREQSRAETSQQLALDAFPRTEKESAYQSWKKMVSRETDLKNANFDEIQEYLGSKTANQRFEDALDRQDVVGGDYSFDELVSTFQKRYSKETAAKASKTSAAESGKAVAEAFKKMPDRVKVAIRRELKAAREAGAIDSAALTKKITDRVLKAEQRHIERGPMRRRLLSIERTRVMKNIRKLAKKARITRTDAGNRKSQISIKAQQIMNGSKKDGIVGVVAGLNMKRNVVMAKAAKEMIDWRNAHPEAIELPESIVLNMQIAKTSGIGQQTMRELRETEAFVQDVVENGLKDRQAATNRKKERTQKFADSITKYLTGSPSGKAIKDSAWFAPKEGAALKAGRSFFWDTAPTGHIMEQLGPQAQRLFAKTVKADETTRLKALEAAKLTQSVGAEVYGSAKNFAKNYLRTAGRKVELGTFKNAAGVQEKLTFSRLQAMAIHAGMKDGMFALNMTSPKGNAFTPEMLSAVDSLLSPEDKAYITRIVKELYGGSYKRFAEAVQRNTGEDLGFVENFAGTIKREKDNMAATEDAGIDLIKDNLIRDMKVRNNATKQRTGIVSKMRISEDPVFDAVSYVRGVEHYIQMSELMSDWNVLTNGVKDGKAQPPVTTLQRAIVEKYGESFYNNLALQIEDIKSNGMISGQVLDTAKAINIAQSQTAGALMFSPTVVIGQLSSIAQFKAEAGIGSGFGSGMWNAKKNLPILEKYAKSVKTRDLGSVFEIMGDAKAESEPGIRSAVTRTLKWIRTKQSSLLAFADRVATVGGASGMFEVKTRKYMKEGKSLEEARVLAGRDVDLAIVNTQSTSSHLGKSMAEKTDSIMRLVTPLRNQPNKMARNLLNTWVKVKKGEMSAKEAVHHTFYASVMQPTVYFASRYGLKLVIKTVKYGILSSMGGAIAKAMADGLLEEMKEDEKNWFNDYLSALASNSSGYFGIGDIVNLLLAKGLSDKDYVYRPAVIQTLMDDIISTFKAGFDGDLKSGIMTGTRGLTRASGVGDFAGIFQLWNSAIKNLKKQEKETPEYKAKKKLETKEKNAEKAKEKGKIYMADRIKGFFK